MGVLGTFNTTENAETEYKVYVTVLLQLCIISLICPGNSGVEVESVSKFSLKSKDGSAMA